MHSTNWIHKISQGFEFFTKERKWSFTAFQSERQESKGRGEAAHRGEEEGSPRSPEHGRRRWPPVEIAGEGEIARRRELGGWEKTQSLWLGSVGLGAVF
jgi:hypothetical protein